MRWLLYSLSVLTLVQVGTFQKPGCNVPPTQWCSSRETALKCQVYEQCREYAWEQSSKPVDLDLYFESLCPACKAFISNQLWPVYQDLGPSVINITLVPFGNAREEWVAQAATWNFTCQHGPLECLGNVIETCAIGIMGDFDKYFPFIHCTELPTTTPDKSAQKCASQHNIPWDLLSQCVNGSLGNKLEHLMALKTQGLQPPHHYTPWVVLNGQHDESQQRRAQLDLKGLICDLYQGPKPDACTKKEASISVCPRDL